jgi:hypothetical protein
MTAVPSLVGVHDALTVELPLKSPLAGRPLSTIQLDLSVGEIDVENDDEARTDVNE